MKSILKTARMVFACFLLVAPTGCLGPKVLKERAAHYPAPDPKVELWLKTNAPADVLVIYDDQGSQSDKVTRRAFYLFVNQDRIGNRKRPIFVKLSEANHLEKIPILKISPTGHTTNEIYAIEITSRQFRLVSHDQELAEFALPEYYNWLTAKKLFLFPAAVGADAAGVGAAAGAAMVYGMAQSGTTIPIHSH